VSAEAAAVAVAREKFHCPACGAEASWNPGKQALVCSFCGTTSPAQLQTRGAETIIVEHDLVLALRSIPDTARGWQTEKVSARCQSCQAISVFDAGKAGQRCEFCGSSQLLPYQGVKEAFTPESLLQFKVPETRARELIRSWLKARWFAPNNFSKRALTDTIHGLYLPYWTFDAKADASWTADSGTYYYSGTGKNRRRHVRWTPASGQVSHVFDDELVAASAGIDAKLLRSIEPFPTNALIPYDPGYLAGWTVERYQIDLGDAAARSRERMDEKLRSLCKKDVPGDTHRSLVVNSTFSDQRFKHILVPVWLLSYTWGAKSFQVVINGFTEKIDGRRPWSRIKIALLVIAIVLVVFPLVQRFWPVILAFLPEILDGLLSEI
jgi:hypothetical protein